MSPEGFVVKVEPGNMTIGSTGKTDMLPAMSQQHAESLAKKEAGPGKTVKIESLGDVRYVEGESDSKVASKS